MAVSMDKVFTLWDDESTRQKLTVMSKWDAMFDDSRNPEQDLEGEVEAFIQPGKSYRIRIIVEEYEFPPGEPKNRAYFSE